jgi:hypothetical protein
MGMVEEWLTKKKEKRKSTFFKFRVLIKLCGRDWTGRQLALPYLDFPRVLKIQNSLSEHQLNSRGD